MLSPHAEIIYDQAPYEGPLAALCAALVWSPRPRVLVIAGDLVLLRAEVIERLASLAISAKAFAPVIEGVIQPLCAVYSSSLSGEALRLLSEGARAAKALFVAAQGETVSLSQLGDVAEITQMLRGVNTREELASLGILNDERGR